MDWRVHRHPELDSTSGHLKRLATSAEPPPFGTVVVADHQTAGYGQRGRSWVSPPRAGLLCSVLLAPSLATGWLPLLAGLAAVEGAESASGAPGLGVKWVNDVVADRRKLGGILAEGRAGRWVVLGVGLNVLDAPPEGVCLADLAGGRTGLSVDAVLEAFLDRLAHWLARWESQGRLAVAEAWTSRSVTLGRPVRVEGPDGSVVLGHAEGLGPEGQLRVRLVDGSERLVVAGTVRTPDGAYC